MTELKTYSQLAEDAFELVLASGKVPLEKRTETMSGKDVLLSVLFQEVAKEKKIDISKMESEVVPAEEQPEITKEMIKLLQGYTTENIGDLFRRVRAAQTAGTQTST